MWVRMKLSRGQRDENRTEKEEHLMRQRRSGWERENKKQRCQWGGVVQKCQGEQENKPGKEEEFPLVVAKPPMTLERETPFKEHREVRQCRKGQAFLELSVSLGS